MFEAGQIISYLEMCQEEGVSLQRGMNFRLRDDISVLLMSLRRGAPYSDDIRENGRVLIYEGHDVARSASTSDPKIVDQPMTNPNGSLTQNGLFYGAAQHYKEGRISAPLVRVYEKVRDGIWVFNGLFELVDAWVEASNRRRVFKFRLELADVGVSAATSSNMELEHSRVIPSWVKLEVWKRDRGRCVVCGSDRNLHFDHIIPYSRGGSSLVPENIQLLCAEHNLEKRDRIE